MQCHVCILLLMLISVPLKVCTEVANDLNRASDKPSRKVCVQHETTQQLGISHDANLTMCCCIVSIDHNDR